MNSLPFMPLRPHTDDEWGKLPHGTLNSDKDWDPTLLDCEGDLDNQIWFDAQSSFPDGPDNKNFYEVGNYRHRSIPDSAKSEINLREKDIIRSLFIDDQKSEEFHQYHNLAERRCQKIKSYTNIIFNRTGDPACTWLL